MKTYAFASALFLLALATPMTAANSPCRPAYGYPVSEVAVAAGVIHCGTLCSEVLQVLGPASHQATEDLWLYRRFRITSANASADAQCTILVLTFAHGAVADMKIVNAPAENVIVASVRAGNATNFVVDQTGLPAADAKQTIAAATAAR